MSYLIWIEIESSGLCHKLSSCLWRKFWCFFSLWTCPGIRFICTKKLNTLHVCCKWSSVLQVYISFRALLEQETEISASPLLSCAAQQYLCRGIILIGDEWRRVCLPKTLESQCLWWQGVLARCCCGLGQSNILINAHLCFNRLSLS